MPFQNILVAVTFSPRLAALVCEAVRVQKVWNSKLLFLHVGEKTSEKEKILENLLTQYQATGATILWEKGSIVKKILAVCQNQKIDLLLAGALAKETMLKYYIGSTARELVRKAACPVLILISPSLIPKPFQKIAIHVDENRDFQRSLEMGFSIARLEKAQMVYITKEVEIGYFKMLMSQNLSEEEIARLKSKITNKELEFIQNLLKNFDTHDIIVKPELLYGKAGFELKNFAQEHSLDLIVLNAPDISYGILGRLFQHDVENLLEELPCNLLIIKEN
ncbi:MAG: universal stress protein [Deltaproteobacteria bacterium]|nr:universal stress protein [Deltaproteobacteria bacterium]